MHKVKNKAGAGAVNTCPAVKAINKAITIEYSLKIYSLSNKTNLIFDIIFLINITNKYIKGIKYTIAPTIP